VGKAEVSKYHRYCFEMEMEINSALTFSAGELCALLTDGLFALDDMGTLFPGVKSPDVGERLTSIRMGATGYMRGLAAPTEDAYRRFMFGPKPPRTGKANRDCGHSWDYREGGFVRMVFSCGWYYCKARTVIRNRRRTPNLTTCSRWSEPLDQPSSSTGWPCGVLRYASAQACLRQSSDSASVSPFAVSRPSSAATQCS
jgi:hypothetical protein